MAALLRRHRAARARGEAGFSVLEVTVVTMMMGLMTMSIFGVLTSTSRNEKLQQSMVGNQELVRFGIIQLSRDLRSANPVEPLTTIGSYATSVELALGASSGTQTYVRWWLSNKVLYRSLLSAPNGTITSTRTVLTNVENASQGITLLRYYNASAVELATSGTTPAAVGDITNCAIRVHISVASDAFPGPVPFTEQSDVELRNRLPGGPGC
jgi:type II secretory pathway component PulJ